MTLNLSDNALSIVGAEKISNFIRCSVSLKNLLLANCGLGPEGAEILADSLIESPANLETLDVARNRMKGDGGNSIAKYLDHYNSIMSLNVGSNSIDQDGMEPLLKALAKSQQTLTDLFIQDNMIDHDTFGALIDLIKSCGLQKLDISDSGINKRKRQKKIIETMEESEFKNTIVEFKWNNDIEQKKIADKLFDSLLNYPENLKLVCASGLIKKRTNRLGLRTQFAERGVQVLLSEREVEPQSDDEDESDSFSEDEESGESSSD